MLLQVSTVKISNVSRGASVQDIKEFFSFSGDIVYIEMQSVDESSQVAYVTFKDSQGAETALLLTFPLESWSPKDIPLVYKELECEGAKICDLVIDITPAVDYQLPATVLIPPASNDADEGAGGIGSAVRKAENVVTTMLAKGFVLGKDALNKAKSFDEKHQLTSTASAKVSDLDKRMGLSEKISMGTAAVNEKVMEMDQKYQVSEKTRSAIAAAEQKVSTAGAAIMKNRYVFTGAAWVTGALGKVARAASDVGTKAMDKAATEQERRKVEEQLAKGHESGGPKDSTTFSKDSTTSNDSPTSKDSPAKHQDKPEPAQGSIP
ncbi:RRM [Musa troglodytarum]|uniref:RRM n=1 Tax=Musa troglodytarum TaxID=320322 RepID=A0A9E7L3N2_9LILI|nr:RRM [Musa troglodytarum]